MGSCGCGDHASGFTLPGPKAMMYHISFYPGCEYCANGPGWTIYRLEAKEEDFFEMRDDPPIVFRDDQHYLNTLEPGDLVKKLKVFGIEEHDKTEVTRALYECSYELYEREHPSQAEGS